MSVRFYSSLKYILLAALIVMPGFGFPDTLPIRMWDEASNACKTMQMFHDRGRTGDYEALLSLFTTVSCLFFFTYSETKKTKCLYLFFATLQCTESFLFRCTHRQRREDFLQRLQVT